MCVLSMVHDHYSERLPWVVPTTPTVPLQPVETSPDLAELLKPSISLSDLVVLIKEFRELVEAAKLIDLKTGRYRVIDGQLYKVVETGA